MSCLTQHFTETTSDHSDDESCDWRESLDTKVNNNKVNVLLQDLDKETLMLVMKIIDENKFKYSFQCGIIEYEEFQPHHQFSFGDEYDPGEGGQNELNQEMYMITYIRDNDTLPIHMKPFVMEFVNKVEKYNIQYEDILSEDEMITILSKAKKMSYY